MDLRECTYWRDSWENSDCLQTVADSSHWETHRDIAKYLYRCPVQDHRESHLRSCRSDHRFITPAGIRGLSTREVE